MTVLDIEYIASNPKSGLLAVTVLLPKSQAKYCQDEKKKEVLLYKSRLVMN